MTWNAWAVPGTLTALFAWTAAVVMVRIPNAGRVNRRLAVLLVMEGILALGYGPIFFVESRELAFGIGVLATAALATLPPLYLAFLGVSLRTKLVRPFRSRAAFLALVGLAVVAFGVVVLRPHVFVTEAYDPGFAPWNFRYEAWGTRVAQLHGVSSIFGLVAALAAYRVAEPGTAGRDRAKWFAIAFGARDAYLGIIQPLFPVLRPIPFWGDVLYNPGVASAYLIYLVLLAYGVLRLQLFDIDLKIRFAVRQSTVGALVAGLFLIVSEVVESLVPVRGRTAGVVAALAIVAFLDPVRRFALRLTDRLMANVTPTTDYLETRKLEVYGAALEGALEDGRITDREVAILRRLQEQLGLTDADVRSARTAAGLSAEGRP